MLVHPLNRDRRYATITLTFSECVENHIHNQQIGNKSDTGFSTDTLRRIGETYAGSEYHDLSEHGEDAGLLIIRNGVDALTGEGGSDQLLHEQMTLTPDSKYWDNRRKKVLNKLARHNLCYADFDQEADYENGMGTVISFSSQPWLACLRHGVTLLTGMELFAEGNYYHRNIQSGIGFHGDTERMYVLGVRLGDSMPLVYRWYKDCKFTGKEYSFHLDHGDVYLMSEKATGYDWRRRSIHTLRHAAGSSKYIDPVTKSHP